MDFLQIVLTILHKISYKKVQICTSYQIQIVYGSIACSEYIQAIKSGTIPEFMISRSEFTHCSYETDL